MKILCCPWAGGEPKNPAYVSDEVWLNCLDLAVKGKFNWVSFNWAFDYMWQNYKNPRHERLKWILTECMKRELAPIMIHGAGPYPNQPQWVQMSEVPTWKATSPPQGLYGVISDCCSMSLQYAWDVMHDCGVDPSGCAVWQPHREPGRGGVGQSDLTVAEGIWDDKVKQYIEYLTWNVNTLGFLMASPSLECQQSSFDNEIKSAFNKSWARYDLIFAHLYEWKDSPMSRALYQSILIRDGLTAVGVTNRDIVWGEMGSKGMKNLDTISGKMVESHVKGCTGAGWYCAYEKPTPKGKSLWSLL